LSFPPLLIPPDGPTNSSYSAEKRATVAELLLPA